MKENLLRSVSVTKLLISSFCGLLALVAAIRFIEYKQTRGAAAKIEAITKTANKKLALLVSISQSYANDQKRISQYIHNRDGAGITGRQPVDDLFATGYDSSLLAYQQVIRTHTERMAFNELLNFDKVSRQLNDSFLLAVAGNPATTAQPHFGTSKIEANAQFNAAIQHLLLLVSKESQLAIAEVSKHFVVLARRKELGSYLGISLLLVLGLAIGQALKKLRRTENKYRLLFDHSLLPKFLIDPSGFHVLDVNNASVELYGYSKTELLKMRAFDLRRLPPRELTNLEAEFDRLVKAGSSFSAKARHYKKNNEAVDVEINMHNIFAGDRKVLLATINDITEKEKTEKKITGAIIKTQEDERRQLGADLHDNVGQILVSTQLYLSMAANKEYGNPEKFLAETQKYLSMAINETRNISHRVFPAFLEEIPLPEAIDHLLDAMNPGGKLDVNFEYDSWFLADLINDDLKLHIYRMLQEQLKNIQKYSLATAVQMELRKGNNIISVQIVDNGIGFDATRVKFGIGLLNIKKRAELLSGKFLLTTAPRQGCSIKVEIPIAAGESESLHV